MFVHPSRRFWHKFGDGQLLWLRNMTWQVAGGQANFGWKYLFFQLLSTIKVNLVAKILQSTYLCVIFHVNHKTLPFLAVLSWFLLLGKIQDGGQDGYHCWWRHRPPAAPLPIKYTSPCWEEQRLSTKGKLVSKYCNISKTPGRGSIHPLPPVEPRQGYEFACTSEG